MRLTLPKWFDLHTHFRQGPAVAAYVKAHKDMGCAGALAMPNTQPPVSRVSGAAQGDGWSIDSYTTDLRAAGADAFEQLIVPLYLTRQTTAEMIREGAASGALRACKYYPPHGTTNAEHGMPMDELIGSDVFKAMEDAGVVLCIHGEQHALSGPEYIDAQQNAETRFYSERMPRLVEAHPRLRIVCEHITTRTAAEFVASAPAHVGATITPQHLLYTLGHLIQGLKYHLYCLPVVKFQDDRAALRKAVTTAGQAKYFAGTDSAPHTTKATACGCAAGCFTGGCAPQLYAMAFEEAGVDLGATEGQALFERFLCLNGPAFYGFPASTQQFQMEKASSKVEMLETAAGPVTPLPVGMGIELTWRIVA
ncbi:dihydroorotase [Roseimicrobium gellanilyticum]|uniref:Dihydroorotase n=1 Tax=Roseimicrobium gellanilyticum TaxID=748857 RepID=A0A366HJ33_9BACT|nr:dihydroorotase [Roseimicrobium gellanilyticum]RBP42672.1 dihydroorotase [Roseimicrobium gellanilyticum]